jgi:D-alanyl-D-alanine carboxypeptidase
MIGRLLLSTLTAVALIAPAAPAVAAPRPAGDGTERLLPPLLEAERAAGMPGLFAQFRNGNRTQNLAAGVADLATGSPARPYFRHRVGSITKTFIAATVLQLAGERRVRLDAPVARYLPGLLPGDLGGQVTVRMLLNHTSGLGDYDDVLLAGYEEVEALQFRTVTPQELIRTGLSQPPTNAPGERWSYSNTNYIILGLLIEKVTGNRYASEVTRRILRPLGLRDTYFPGTDPAIRGPHMGAYVVWSDGTPRDFQLFNMSWGWAAGELISTAADLNRFYRALLTGRVLSRPLLKEMQTTVPLVPEEPEAGGYGLGLFWLPAPCGPIWGHDGGVVGHTTFSLHTPDARRQVTLAENLILYEGSAIDEARNNFLITALCGPQPETSTRGTPLLLPRVAGSPLG